MIRLGVCYSGACRTGPLMLAVRPYQANHDISPDRYEDIGWALGHLLTNYLPSSVWDGLNEFIGEYTAPRERHHGSAARAERAFHAFFQDIGEGGPEDVSTEST